MDKTAIVCQSVTGEHIRLIREDFSSEEEFLFPGAVVFSTKFSRTCAVFHRTGGTNESKTMTSYKEVRIGNTIYRVTSVFTGEKDLGKTLEQLAIRRAMTELRTRDFSSINTFGASTTAAFTVTLKMTEDREELDITRAFWSAYVKNLRHGVPLTAILLVGGYVVWLNWQCFEKLEGNPIGFLLLAVLGVLLLIVHFLYLFPLEARYENKLLPALSNTRNIFIRYFGRTMGLIGTLLIQFLFFTQVHPAITYAGLFCMPILMIYTTSQIIMPLFRKIEKTGGAEETFEITSDLY